MRSKGEYLDKLGGSFTGSKTIVLQTIANVSVSAIFVESLVHGAHRLPKLNM
jgi:hypothetical protein